MPHFIIEHGGALRSGTEMQDAMQIAVQCGAECGFIGREDIKVRLMPYAQFLAVDGRTSFLHVTVRLLAGRTPAQKEALSCALRDGMAARFADVESVSIEICDMDPGSYKKRLA